MQSHRCATCYTVSIGLCLSYYTKIIGTFRKVTKTVSYLPHFKDFCKLKIATSMICKPKMTIWYTFVASKLVSLKVSGHALRKWFERVRISNHLRDHEGVGIAHKIISPKTPSIFPGAVLISYNYVRPNKF